MLAKETCLTGRRLLYTPQIQRRLSMFLASANRLAEDVGIAATHSLGVRHCSSPSMNGNRSWRSSSLHTPLEREVVERLLPTSCFIGQPLALDADQRGIRGLLVADIK